MEKKIVLVDFDSTIYTEVYPGVGELIPGARETINWLHDLGHIIIINTCREGVHAEVAMSKLDADGVKWKYFNHNDPKRVEQYGNDSRKLGGDICIDDRDIHVKSTTGVVDWKKTRRMLEQLLLPKKKIICIVGESGTGKTFLAEYLRQQYGIPMIESYTDRPKRTPDEVGHTFLSKEEFDDLNMAEMIAFTCWPGADGEIVRYCCLEGDVDSEVSTYVIDERGLRYLKKYWSHIFRIFAVRMSADEHEIAKRTDPARRNRDKGLFTMGEEWFDCFIHNDYSKGMYKKYDSLYERTNKL